MVASPLGAAPGPSSGERRSDGEPLLEVRGLSKSFGPTRALCRVDLRIAPGEVRGLVGENGSGKSTLVKVLAGYHVPDPGGEVRIGGEHLEFPLTGARARRAGLHFVHQDLGLIPALSVTENLFADRYSVGRSRSIRWREEHARARASLERFGVEVDPTAPLSSLPMEQRVMVAIVRALEGIHGAGEDGDRSGRRGVLVLDEPTVSLPKAGRERLQAMVAEVVAAGHGVLFISHYPDEVLGWADRVTVLRDGSVVADRATSELAERDLVELIIGRALDERSRRLDADNAHAAEGEIRLAGLDDGELRGVSLGIRMGEVLGVTGLLGSGFEEICQALAGARRPRAGELHIETRVFPLHQFTPGAARQAGIAFVPQDRLREGGSAALSLEENLSLAIMDRFQGALGRIRHRELEREVRRLLEEFNVKPPRPEAKLRELSGGNQQKVVMAKAMALCPKLLVLLEPTQGVDVGARGEILDKVREIAGGGSAVVIGSTDAEQLAQVADRVVVLRRGQVVAELSGADITKDRIVEEMYRPVAEAAGAA